MAWTPLSDRIHHLPLILAGPILRRTEPESVTVWVALQNSCEVTLEIYSTHHGNGMAIQELMLRGTRTTIPIGKHLHLVAVTARSIGNDHLISGQVYAYDLRFEDQQTNTHLNLQHALSSDGFPNISVSYFEHQLPTLPSRPMI